MTQTRALSTPGPSAPLAPTTIERRALRDDDILIDIAYAGICHSDIHQVREEWGTALFPMVPGHEIAGTVVQVGAGVTRFKVGDRVGVGCMVDSCGECEWCKNDQEQFCLKGNVPTYNGKNYDGEVALGGYSQQLVVTERFAARIPDNLELDVAAPLLCAGITTYSPLKRWGAGPGRKVAVVGLGGLGHMAVKIAAAMGSEVTVLSRSMAKKDDAEALGATDYVATGEPGAAKELKGRFDVVLSTVSAGASVRDYLRMLRPFGVLANVGLPTENFEVPPGMIIGGNKAVAGSNIGGIAETQEMLDFCGEHGLGSTIETIGADEVNAAYDRVVAGDVRYRFVIDVATIPEA